MPIIFHDGDCGFCSRMVIFVAARDPRVVFRFAPLQSEMGMAVASRAGLADPPDTLVLLDGERVLTRSDAVLAIVRGMRMPWPLLGVFRLVPRGIRDAVYDLVARNRHRLSGDHCVLPSQLEGRLIGGSGGATDRHRT